MKNKQRKKPIAYAKKHNKLPTSGTRLCTKATLGSTEGIFVAQRYFDTRKPNTAGIYSGWVPGHGGDVWWVKHDDDSVAVYMFSEVKDVS